MKTRISLFSCLFVSLWIGVASLTWAESRPLNKKMKELRAAFMELLPDVLSESRFMDPKNYKSIERNTAKLSRLSHDLKVDTKHPDPSLHYVSELFEEEARRALQELKRGNRAYARGILKTVTNFCMACHTRTAGGPKFTNMSLPDGGKGFTEFEKSQYLVATRQFEEALKGYERILSNKQLASSRPFEWERAAHQALSVSVRVLRDPEATLRLVDQVLKMDGLPEFLRAEAQQWRKSALDWKREKGESKEGSDLLAQAKELMDRAQKNQEFPLDSQPQILYLRASALLHDYLSTPQLTPIKAAEALYLSGMCYELLKGFQLWTLQEFYYAGCIHTAPHTEVAKDCFHRYEQSIYAGYSGSAGVFVPEDVKARLSKLRILATP